jgi:hypothetical protein
MFRKIGLALAAATVVATAAIPTTASAHASGWRHHHRGPGVVVRVAPRHYAYAPHCYTKKRWVQTRWGGWRVKRVRVCR